MKDAVVIGGGFYGVILALYLKKKRKFERVFLLEQESALLLRASYNNQARVHNGYHYPRSFTTAFRSRVNLPAFIQDFGYAVKKDFSKVYAIARRNSKVTSRQFVNFCKEIGAKCEPASQSIRKLFEPRLIEDVFLVQEYAFDASCLRAWALVALKEAGVELHLNTQVIGIKSEGEGLNVLGEEENQKQSYLGRVVFNCTYSGLNQIQGLNGTQTKLKHEITEMALMKAPASLIDLGITVMDGPFFSMMPFPARELHTLSHVRYTPHMHWEDEMGSSPYQKLEEYDKKTRVDRMVRDVARYMPAVLDAEYIDSLFEVKTILQKNEGDDGRPILFEKSTDLPGFYSVLGGKIDNIYDVLERLDGEEF